MAVVKSGRKTASGADIFMAAPSTPTQAVTRPTSGGGTITVTSSGKVTERTAEGKLVSQEKVSKEAASRVVEQEAQKIEAERVADVAAKAEAREQGALTPTRPEGLEIGSISQMTPTQTTGIIQRPELQATRTPLGTGGIVFTSGLGVQQIDTGVEPSMGIVGGAADLTTEPTGDVSIYQKLDRALGGYLPGGVKPKEAKLPVSPVTGIAYSYEAIRPKLSSGLSKVAKVINPYSKEATIGQVKLRYERAQELERAGRLEEPKGFQALNPFKEESKIGRQIIRSVKAGKTFEEFRARGKGQKGLDIAIWGSEKIREQPLEVLETGAVIYATGKLTGTAGYGTMKFAESYIKSRAIRFTTIDLPVYYAESKALGLVTEKFMKERGFTEKEASTTAYVARVLQAEAFGNIQGTRDLDLLPKFRPKTGVIAKWVGGFKAKIYAGAAEGGPAVDAFFDWIGDKTISIGNVGIGGDKALPGKEMITTPRIDTLSDPKYKTETITISQSKWEKLQPQLESKTYTGKELEGFTNKLYQITKDDKVIDQYSYGVKVPEVTKVQYNIGRIGTFIGGAAFGSITAGTFGGFEAVFSKTKGGRIATTAVGYVADPPEYPGDVLTGTFTPIGGLDIVTKTKVPTTSVFISQQFGTPSQMKEFGGEISRIKVNIKTPEASFTGVKDMIRVEPPTPGARTATSDFGFTGTGTPASVKDIIRTGTRTKTRTMTQTKDISVVSVNIPTITNVRAMTKERTYQPIISGTEVSVPSVTDVTIPSPVSVDVPSVSDTFTKVNVETITQTQAQATQVSNVFTPRFIIPPILPSGGGGGSVFFGRRRKGRRVSKYLPSLAAVGSGIKGRKPLVGTGLFVRPIPIKF